MHGLLSHGCVPVANADVVASGHRICYRFNRPPLEYGYCLQLRTRASQVSGPNTDTAKRAGVAQAEQAGAHAHAPRTNPRHRPTDRSYGHRTLACAIPRRSALRATRYTHRATNTRPLP